MGLASAWRRVAAAMGFRPGPAEAGRVPTSRAEWLRELDGRRSLAELAKEMSKEHAEICSTLADLRRAAESGRWQRAEELLAKFKVAVREHEMRESALLYSRLRERWRSEAWALETLAALKAEMDSASRAIADFAVARGRVGSDPRVREGFLGELGRIGAIWLRRTLQEEAELFPLASDPSGAP